jgi:hypothetical protein
MTHPQQPAPDERALEQLIGSVLRQQPLRRAPATLEARVLRELAVRAAHPWWQLGFSHWPRAARILCLPVGMALVPLSFLITSRLLSLWQSVQQSTPANAAQSGWRWLENLGQALQALGNVVTREIPQWWVYGGACAALLMYAALFGLGAAAFRTLFVTSEPVRYPS